jgi:hypothetical protein
MDAVARAGSKCVVFAVVSWETLLAAVAPQQTLPLPRVGSGAPAGFNSPIDVVFGLQCCGGRAECAAALALAHAAAFVVGACCPRRFPHLACLTALPLARRNTAPLADDDTAALELSLQPESLQSLSAPLPPPPTSPATRAAEAQRLFRGAVLAPMVRPPLSQLLTEVRFIYFYFLVCLLRPAALTRRVAAPGAVRDVAATRPLPALRRPGGLDRGETP